MIVKCKRILSPVSKEDLGDKSPWLIKDKEYIVLALNISSESGISICIQTEQNNQPAYFSLDGFEVISQHMPSTWITTVKNIDTVKFIDIEPERWRHDSFFDDLHDQKPEAIEIFNKEAELIYTEEKNKL